MSLSKKIKSLLKKNGVAFIDKFSEVENESDLLEIFSKTIPERLYHYDAECIDCPEDYGYLLREHAAITLGEFIPEDIKLTAMP